MSGIAPPPVDIGRFDLRVSKILHILEHPIEESKLYLQNIVYYDSNQDDSLMEFKLAINDLASRPPYSMEELDDKLVIALCNPQPEVKQEMTAKAKLMCATTDNQIELLEPPPGSEPGDLVRVSGYPRQPEHPFLLPVEDAYQRVCAELRVDADRRAVYRGVPLEVEGKGYVTTRRLADCPVLFE